MKLCEYDLVGSIVNEHGIDCSKCKAHLGCQVPIDCADFGDNRYHLIPATVAEERDRRDALRDAVVEAATEYAGYRWVYSPSWGGYETAEKADASHEALEKALAAWEAAS